MNHSPPSTRATSLDTGSDVPATAESSPREGTAKALKFLRRHAFLFSILFGSFLIRLLLADWNSYWLDELYSVTIYGIWNDSTAEAIQTLAATSVHPPLYQFILYNWMGWFGNSEIATRTLSNVYVTLAALFLYLALDRRFSRPLALTSTLAFSLMHATMLFGLETRSYAQTICLAALSSYFLLSMLPVTTDQRWQWSPTSWTGLVLSNTALLLTHYYNALFLGAQVIIALAYVLRVLPARQWPAGVGVLTALYGLPGLLFAGIWGSQFVATFDRMSGVYAVEDSTEVRNPLDLLADLAQREVSLPTGLIWIFLIVGVVLAGSALVSISRSPRMDAERRAAWSVTYLVGWFVLPVTLSYLAFSILGVARYSPRYFLFSAVPLAPLTLLAIRFLWRSMSRLSTYARRRFVDERWLVAVLAVVVVTVFMPGTLEAAYFRKTDWRGTAQSIVAISESNPESSYAILEPAFRKVPVIDYYLDRYGAEFDATGTIRRGSERAGGPFPFEADPDLIRGYDYLILPFVHHRVSQFPLAVNRLEELYPVHLKQIDRNGHGLIIFRLSDAS